MNKLRTFLSRMFAPKKQVTMHVPGAMQCYDEQYGREYIRLPDGLRLYFEDGQYVGFSTQLPNPEG